MQYICYRRIVNKKEHDEREAEAVVWRCSVEKVFLEISKNSQENTCDRVSFLIKIFRGLQLY